jgi:2-polyprenyl-3-methyl-5-hydroxy-6-metoxy-1,4-benzoquinol methylase
VLQWYEFLSSARGISRAEDIRLLTAQYAAGYQRLLKSVLPSDKDAPIYDTGCGPGLALNILKTLGYRNLEGTDLSATSVAIAQELGLHVTQANSIDDLAARADGSFSRILAIDLIEHLEKPDLLRFLQVARAKLREDGMLILRCPNGGSPLVGHHFFNDITHVWTYTAVSLSAVLTMSGYKGAVFLDETQPFIRRRRWLNIPIVKVASPAMRLFIRAATKEDIKILAPSFWIVATVG